MPPPATHPVAGEYLPSVLSGIEWSDNVHRPNSTIDGKVAQTKARVFITLIGYVVDYEASATAPAAAIAPILYLIEKIGHFMLLVISELGVEKVCQFRHEAEAITAATAATTTYAFDINKFRVVEQLLLCN